MEADVQDFLEHYGVKGMRWGVRGTRRAQRTIDRTKRVAEGTASAKDRLLAAAITKRGAQKKLQRGANQQAKMNAGKMKVANTLSTVVGVKIKDLDYGVKGDANAGLSGGQKAAIALIAGVGAVKIVKAGARSVG